jgi:predicted O-methyltransferase YrrM
MREDEAAEQFTATMDSRGRYLGPVLAERLNLRGRSHVLDVAGSSGIYACCIAAAHSHVKATVFERPPVDRIAAQYVARRGFSNRVDIASGDMHCDPFPAGCDVHPWSNVFHDWNVSTVKRLLAKSFAALPPGGLIAIHDKYLNRDKTGPLGVAVHSVYLMALTEGRFYSTFEIEAFLAEAGFRNPDCQELSADYTVITARRP